MSRRKIRSLFLNDPRIIALVGSPQRFEILASLGNGGPATAAELGERLGRSPHSLYFHLRKLEEAGVVRVCETREVRGQIERTWEAAAERVLVGSGGQRGSASAAAGAADAMLRLTSRELRRGLARAERVPGEEGTLIGVRMKGRLDEKSLARIRELVEEMEALIRKSQAIRGGRMHAITVVVTPAPDAQEETS